MARRGFKVDVTWIIIDWYLDSPHNPMQVIFFNELAVSEQRIKNAMSTFGELTQEPFQVFDVSIFV